MEQKMNKGRMRFEPTLFAKMLGLPECVQIDDAFVEDGEILIDASNEGDPTQVTIPWKEGEALQETSHDMNTYLDNATPFIEEMKKGRHVRLSDALIDKEELNFTKLTYDKMKNEQICMGCGRVFEWMKAYMIWDFDLNTEFVGHKHCLVGVKKRIDRLKEKHGIDKVVQSLAIE